jgi:hypothetical protein
MLISKLQNDLLEFIKYDTADAKDLIEFWYKANSLALSASLTEDNGYKLIVNVSSFKDFEKLSKKLFLIADTLILRDTRKLIKSESTSGMEIVIEDYQPKCFNEIINDLKLLEPSPLTMIPQYKLFWSATKKLFNNGYEGIYAGSFDRPAYIPDDFIDWIQSSGKQYLQNESIVYAPFIPPIEYELEFLKNDISVASTFNSTSLFYKDNMWLEEMGLKTLIDLKIPFIDNIDIDTLSKIKQDNYDEFLNFRNSMLNSINNIKGLIGTKEFIKEVQYIQRNDIDYNLSKIKQKIKKFENITSLRKLGICTGLVGIDIAMYFGASTTPIISALSASVVATIMDKATDLKETNEIKNESAYIIWKLGQSYS